MTDPLDRLLREAAGERPDTEPSRRAIRAGLLGGIVKRRRREARTRVARTVAIAALLLLGLISPLGSDDFAITVAEIRSDGTNGEIRLFEQGLRKEGLVTNRKWNDRDLEEFFQQSAAGEGVIVGLFGFRVGGEFTLSVATERTVNGELHLTTDYAAEFRRHQYPKTKEFCRTSLPMAIEAVQSRGPDFTVPMYVNGLAWRVDGWRLAVPGFGEITVYSGVRADGVRGQSEPLF